MCLGGEEGEAAGEVDVRSTEAFLSDAHGRDHVTHAELAIDENGKILGLRVQTKANLGAYLSTFSSSVPTYLYAPLLSGQYDIPAIYCEVDAVYTNTAPVDAYRAPGGRKRLSCWSASSKGPRASSARTLPSSGRITSRSFPHPTPVIMTYDAGDYRRLARQGARDRRLQEFRQRASAKAPATASSGASASRAYIEACGIAPSQAVGSLGAGVGLWESAEVRVNPTGSVEVLTGSHSHGQGHETTFAQLVSRPARHPIDTVSIVHGDTDKVQFGMGTYGSRSGAVGMSAIAKAVDKVIAKGKKVAAHVLEAAEGDIEFKDGKFGVAGTDSSSASARSRCRPTSPTSSPARSWSPA